MKKCQTCENLQGAHGQDLHDAQLYCCLCGNDSIAIQIVRAASTSYVSSSLLKAFRLQSRREVLGCVIKLNTRLVHRGRQCRGWQGMPGEQWTERAAKQSTEGCQSLCCISGTHTSWLSIIHTPGRDAPAAHQGVLRVSHHRAPCPVLHTGCLTRTAWASAWQRM